MSRPEDEQGGKVVMGIARGGALNMAGALFSQIAFFAITVILARTLGRAAVGLYSQGFAFLALLGLLSLGGFRGGLTRFVAMHLADGDRALLRGTVRLGLGLSTLAAVAAGSVLAMAAPWLAHHAFDDAALVTPLRFVAAILPMSVFTDAALSATQGFRTMKPYAYIGLMLEPFLRVTLTIVALVTAGGLAEVMLALLVSNALAAVAAAVALRRLMGTATGAPRYEIRSLFSFSGVSWMASLASTGLIWADTILLGIFRSSADVGVYQVATRMVLLATFVMLPINASLAPHIADLHRRGDTGGLKRAYVAATGWILRLSLPAFMVCLVFPRQLLSIFGRRFEVGVAVTVILACGKLVDSATGPCGLMLNMSGRPGLSLLDNGVALLLNVILNLLLIPAYGIVGSAAAWAVSLGVVNVARVVQVERVMDMLPFDASAGKALGAAVAAAGVGVALSSQFEGFTGLLVGAPAMFGVYGAVVLALGVSAEDRLVLVAASRRLRRLSGATG